MRHAEKCPVCEGEGKHKDKTCHGCNGRGWVEVGVDYPNEHMHRPEEYRPPKLRPAWS